MITAHDIYAETNPAFCSLILASFAGGYLKTSNRNPELICAYLILPLALSQDLNESFAGTNEKTGLLVWVERSPQVRLGLAERVNSTLQITTEAVRFGCVTGSLLLAEDGRLQQGKKPIKIAGKETVKDAVKKSRSLGCWFGATGSSRAVMTALGVTL